MYFCVNCVLCMFLQYFDTVGWVFWPVITVGHITYTTVLAKTLNHAQSINQSIVYRWLSDNLLVSVYCKSTLYMYTRLMKVIFFVTMIKPLWDMAAFAADKRRLVLSTWSANTKYPKSVGRTTSGTPRSQRAPISVRYRISKRRRNSVFGHIARLCEDPSNECLTFSDLISSLSKSCYSHIQELRCIRPYLDSKTASAIAASTPNLTTVTFSVTQF